VSARVYRGVQGYVKGAREYGRVCEGAREHARDVGGVCKGAGGCVRA